MPIKSIEPRRRVGIRDPVSVAHCCGAEVRQAVRQRAGAAEGRNIALISKRIQPRTGFEVAAYDQGAHVTYLGPSGSQTGHKEAMKDTAKVLGRSSVSEAQVGLRMRDQS